MGKLDNREPIKLSARGHSMEHIRNKNETLVAETMEEILPEMKTLCPCSLCTEDIYTIALNSLPPNYRHSMSINLHKKSAMEETREKIREAVRQAAKKVAKKPKHS